jgi:hypothetical protein
MKAMTKQKTFILTPHVCRHCAGGRILQAVSGVGLTGGGNPLYQCADCGSAGAEMFPNHLCWCGWHYKGSTENPYRCASKKDHPEWEQAFRNCGTWDSKCEIGIVAESDIRKIDRAEGNND